MGETWIPHIYYLGACACLRRTLSFNVVQFELHVDLLLFQFASPIYACFEKLFQKGLNKY
jgi:hypothetical protein